MLRTILVALVALLAVTTSGIAQTTDQPASPARPTLKSEAIINGEIVRIGDLIENAGIVASVPIFRAPDLGCTGTVSADTVLDAVRKHALIGVETAGLSEVVVTRASRTIPTSELEEAIKQMLSTRYEMGATKDILVSFTRDTRTIYVEPSAKGEPRVTQIDFDSRSGRFDAVVEIPAATGKRSVVPLSGRAAATVEVATVMQALERGSIVRDADVSMERRARNDVGRDVITRREDIVGLAVRAPLQAGRPIRAAELMKPDLVQRNEAVTLVYEVPGILLTVRGKATESGSKGDVINVLNEQSKRMAQGVIIGPGRVAVYTGSPRVASNTTTASTGNGESR